MRRTIAILALTASLLVAGFVTGATAMVQGLTGTNFTFTAKPGYISTADGGSVYFWGYANGNGLPQYPGPTLILTEGQTVTITLTNQLTEDISLMFPGQTGVSASGGVQGFITREVRPASGPGGASVKTATYTFTATKPGTYLYQSATNIELQQEMGLFGAIIVRPAMGMGYAYNHADTAYDYENLFLLSEIDPSIHQLAEDGKFAEIDMSKFWPVYWFINGRNAPDTMAGDDVPWFPYQPYGSMPRMTPGDKLLMRVANAGKDPHPFHFHGNHARVVARYGRLLESAPGMGPNLAENVFTVQAQPGATTDAIFEWTGKGLNWDVYGPADTHACTDAAPADGYDDVTREWCADHGKPFPVDLPSDLSLTFGAFYSGSPFLGLMGSLPPGEGGMNPNGGFVYMWHSHTEKEMTNFDIFPGGMMTMLIIEPPGTVIEP